MRGVTDLLLVQHVRKCIDTLGKKCCKGVSDDIIKDMESELGLKFTEDYIEFLRCYGEAILGGYSVHGYADVSIHGRVGSVVEKTEFYRDSDWPGIEDWYIISDDGRGNPIGCRADGSVWLSDQYSGFKAMQLASSFDVFIYKLTTNTLFEPEYVVFPPRMNNKDEDAIMPVLLDCLLLLKFMDSNNEEAMISFRKHLIGQLQNISTYGKQNFVKVAQEYAKKYSGDKSAYLEKIVDCVNSA